MVDEGATELSGATEEIETGGSEGGNSSLTTWLEDDISSAFSSSAQAGMAQMKLIINNIVTHNAVHFFTFTLYNPQVTKPLF